MRNLRLNHKKVPALTVDSEAFVTMWNLTDLLTKIIEIDAHKMRI